ncbi:MAG: hypothetical protein QXL43_04060 [Methanolinea sp.]
MASPFPLLPLFLAVLLGVALATARGRVPPFLPLFSGALLLGVAAGMDISTAVSAATAGIGRVFSVLAVVVFSGSVIAKTLGAQGLIDRMVAGLSARVPDPRSLSAVSGFLLALPATCCITAFVVLSPAVRALGGDGTERARLLSLCAAGSVLSYVLVFPTPVTVPLLSGPAQGLSPLLYDLVAVPLGLALLGGLIATSRRHRGGSGEGALPAPPGWDSAGVSSLWSWAPFAAIFAALPVTLVPLALPPAQAVTLSMLAGLAAALLPAPPAARREGLLAGTRHAGVIMFDICGAGALGAVAAAAGVPGEIVPLAGAVLPAALVPFAVAAVLQAALGSRVSAAVAASGILAGSAAAGALSPLPLALSVAAGLLLVSWVTDPLFWLLHRETGATVGEISRAYTLPLALCGAAVLAAALAIHAAGIPP